MKCAYSQTQRLAHPKDSTFPKLDSLKAVIVTATIRPRLKGDTLEYQTGNIKVRPNSNVEDLLRRLPGLQIDASGNLTYNGEKIEHLLVDGVDIFGSQPSLVTRNFDASKIEKVQVLDRKSDQSIFTGIDDGSRTKTLNLVLKSSAKNGYFGKVEAGGNTNGYYNSNGALAAFRNKEQFTALGLAANTGVLGFSGNGGSTGAISFQNSGADPLGASAGYGIPRLTAVALHYGNVWDDINGNLTANYQYSHFFTNPITDTKTIQVQPDSAYGQSQFSQSTNLQTQHWIYGKYELSPNNSSSFRFSFHGSNSQGENQFESKGNSTFNDTLVNSSLRKIQDKTSQGNLGGDLSWRTNIGKRPGRVFFVSTSGTKIDVTTNGYLYSINQYYQPNGRIQGTDTIDQRKQITSHSLNVGGNLGYTEPLWKGVSLGVIYSYSVTKDKPLQATFEKGDGKYQELVDSLSSQFQTRVINQRGTINLQGKIGPFSFTIGNDLLIYNYRQVDLLADSLVRLHYFNSAPHLFVNYFLDKSTFLHFNYAVSTQQPQISQLQPVKNNSDPLFITLGNPDLRPSFNQNMRLEFHQSKKWLIHASLSLALTDNNISTKTITDSLGRQISQPVNVDGSRTIGFNFSINKKLMGLDLGLRGTESYNHTLNFVNAFLNRNDSYTSDGGISLGKYLPDKYAFQLSADFSYLSQVSSINSTQPIHYWTQTHYGSVSLFFLRNFDINTNVQYTWQQKTSAFSANTSVLLWNAYVSRNLLKDKLVFKLQFNNMLNQNAGISRSNMANVNTQTATKILGRYWMLSAIYHFDRQFKPKK